MQLQLVIRDLFSVKQAAYFSEKKETRPNDLIEIIYKSIEIVKILIVNRWQPTLTT